MKVAFWGNFCNIFYSVCKAIRQNDVTIDCHLYLPQDADIQNLPESEDIQLTGNYPSWIHKDTKWDPLLFFNKFDKSMVNELSKYDVVILSGRGISLASFIRTKVVFYVTGGDLTIAPYYDRIISQDRSLLNLAKLKVAAYFQRKGIKSASEIWSPPFTPFVNSLKDFNISDNKIKNRYFPLIIDQDKVKIRHEDEYSIDSSIIETFKKYKFVIFHPSRLIMGKTDRLIKSGQWKHNDLLLHGLKYLVDHYDVRDIGIILPDRMANGYEKNVFMEIVNKLGLDNNVSWIKPNNNQGFTKSEMLDLYSLSDIVVDEFGVGWFGAIVLEAASCTKPVMCYVDERVMNELYPWHPIISVNTAALIAEKIFELYTKPEYKKMVGQKSREWLETFHSSDKAAKVYVDEFTKLKSIN